MLQKKRTKITKLSRKTNHSLRVDAASADVRSNHIKLIKWIEWGLAAVLLLILIILHLIVFLHSGGFWRDEVNSVNISNLTSMTDIWNKLQHDSFPIIWFLLLRAWIFIGFGGTDLALRVLGLIIGLGTLGALWFAGRALGNRLPVISLVLFAMSPTAFFCDSLRAYGLGVLLILLSLGTMWRVFQNPTPWRMVVNAVCILLSVQCLYRNSFLVFAICTGAVTVGLYRRQWKLAIFSLSAGILAAVSVLPYLGIVARVREWTIIMKGPMTLSFFFGKFQSAIDPAGTLLAWTWFVLALLVVIVFIRILAKPIVDRFWNQRDMVVFLFTTMFLSIVAYIGFLKILSYPTQSWYYLPLMAVLIVIIDKGIDVICEKSFAGRIIRIVCAIGIAIFIFTDSWTAAHTRRTNIDVLAAKLETLSAKDDLIVVFPFNCGITFARYYKGATPWITLPETNDHSVHRADMFKIKMMEKEPIKLVLQKITKTLQNGHRVWLVGGLYFLRPGESPFQLPPAPNSPYGWSEKAYQIAWSQQAASALQTYGKTIETITILMDNPVNIFENIPLLVVNDWRP